MAAKHETGIQQRIQKALRQEWPGCYVRKIHVSEFQSGGIPDLLCCIEGRFIAIEVKTKTGIRSELQKWEQEQILRAGGVCIIATSPREAVSLIRKKMS